MLKPSPTPQPKPAAQRWTAEPFLLLLLATDLAFIAVHLHSTSGAAPGTVPLASLERDGGYPEVYGYVKQFWVLLLLVMQFLRRPRATYLAWMPLVAFVLLDDAIRIHEALGSRLSWYFRNLAPATRLASGCGELTYMLLAGAVLLCPVLACRRSAAEPERQFTGRLALLYGVLVFFGMGVDAVHTLLLDTWLSPLLGLLEDGGELVTLSLIAAAAYQMLGAAPPEETPRMGKFQAMLSALCHFRVER